MYANRVPYVRGKTMRELVASFLTQQGDYDTENNRFKIKWHRRNCAIGWGLVAVVVVVWVLLSAVLGYYESIQFRASAPVEFFGIDGNVAPSDIAGTRAVMGEYMTSHAEACGVTAAQFSDFRQYAVMQSNGQLLEIFNPSYSLPRYRSDGKMNNPVRVSELSGVCRRKQPITVNRFKEIMAEYTTIYGINTERLLMNADAACFQHLVSIMQGIWPCPGGASAARKSYEANFAVLDQAPPPEAPRTLTATR